MRHLWCDITYRGLPITPSLLCSVSLCALDLNPVWPHPVSLSLHVTDQFSRPPSPPHVTVTGPGTRGLRRFKWPPPPPLLSSDLGSNRHCAAHNFWRELFLPSENLLNTLNRLNKKHSPTILFLHPVYLLYLPGNIKHSNPLFSDFPDRSMRYFLSEKLWALWLVLPESENGLIVKMRIPYKEPDQPSRSLNPCLKFPPPLLAPSSSPALGWIWAEASWELGSPLELSFESRTAPPHPLSHSTSDL